MKIKKLGLKIAYKDKEVIVYYTPNEEEVEKIIEMMLKEKPMAINEIHESLSNIVSDDKIRKIMRKMEEENKIKFDRTTKKYNLL